MGRGAERLRRIDRLGALAAPHWAHCRAELSAVRRVQGEPDRAGRTALAARRAADRRSLWRCTACSRGGRRDRAAGARPALRLAVALLALRCRGACARRCGQRAHAAGQPGGARRRPAVRFWIVLIALGLLATDALTRLALEPSSRRCASWLSWPRSWQRSASGYFDDLSIMREYAVECARASRARPRQHVLLALGLAASPPWSSRCRSAWSAIGSPACAAPCSACSTSCRPCRRSHCSAS